MPDRHKHRTLSRHLRCVSHLLIECDQKKINMRVFEREGGSLFSAYHFLAILVGLLV